MEIRIVNPPKDLFDIIKKKQLDHLRKCDTCKYGLGQATVAYIRELQKKAKLADNQLSK